MRGVLCVCVLIAVAVLARTDERVAEARGARAHLVFTSNRDGDVDVYATSSDGGRVAALTRNGVSDLVNGVTLSPDGRWIGVTRAKEAALVSADGRREHRLRKAETPVSFSPNAKLVAFGRFDERADAHRIVVRDIASASERQFGLGIPDGFSPDGRRVSFDEGRGWIELRSGERRVVTRDGDFALAFEPWSPKWTRLAVTREGPEKADYTHDELLISIEPGSPSPKRTLVARGQLSFEGWLDERRVLYTDRTDRRVGRKLVVRDVIAGTSRVVARGTSVTSISPTRTAVAYSREQGGATDVFLLETNGWTSRRVARASSVSNIFWSPSGRRLAIWTDTIVFLTLNGLVVRKLPGRAAGGTWSPDERTWAVSSTLGVELFSIRTGASRIVFTGGTNYIIGWARGELPSTAPATAPPPATETAQGQHLRSRARIVEIAADGLRVAALTNESKLDCRHVVAWTAGTQRVVRFRPPAPCGEFAEFEFGLSLNGTLVTWQRHFCGNYCHLVGLSADLRRPGLQQVGDDTITTDPPTRPPPATETRRDVTVSVRDGEITLTASSGRTRTIRPPGGAIDAELETAGLFYAHPTTGTYRGRVVFIPFAQLFG